ncbi:arginine--tRNA ligase [Paenibacillus jamilae]|uniref:Arginine--tRNA ligase n=1 Tax=Paenibacillus jamilae TaxID=114136 RepID=A0ACC4ZZW5_9BACL|nr:MULTISPECIES: arginine--tRNA ligase [Paenibacillus]AUO09157.1 arginine--tRNA ligase [Paenibacillus sp. lzh-N1]KTS84647.1 arginine--tRNA ligase [Paenibacillus jamilae]
MLLMIATHAIVAHTGLEEKEVLSLFEVPPQPEWGDVAFPCFVLAKKFRKSPQHIAMELAELVSREAGLTASASGAYVNITLDRSAHIPSMLAELRKAEFLKPNIGYGQRVVIDMSSPNIAKPFGIGHLRSTVIGAALYRILGETGYVPISVNHLGDWGTQFGKQIAAYKRWGNEEQLQHDPIGESLKLYVRFHQEAEHDPSLEDEGREWFRRLEQGDTEAQQLWEFFVEVSLGEFDRMYQRLNISFDHVLGESFYNDKMQAVVAQLRAKGLLEESDGALVVRLEDEQLPPCLILKKDGTTIYPTRDLATAIYRHEVMKADRLLYVVGGEQKLHFQQVFAVLKHAGETWAEQCEHVPFGLMRFAGKKMSTRRGKVVKLEEVLDEAVARAQDIITEKNPNLLEQQAIAEDVGIGAIIFGDLKNNRLNEVDFSLEEALTFEGETGPYVQYTHARIRSLLEKARAHSDVDSTSSDNVLAQDGHSPDLNIVSDEMLGDAGWALLKQLDRYHGQLIRAARQLEPSVIARFALDTAQAFNRFYAKERIVDGGQWRIQLAEQTADMLASTLRLLGLKAPNRM